MNLRERIHNLATALPDKVRIISIEEILSKIHWEVRETDPSIKFEDISKMFAESFQSVKKKMI